MRIEIVVMAIKKKRQAMTDNVYERPPSGGELGFAQQKGVWLGLGEALNIISEELKKELTDD